MGSNWSKIKKAVEKGEETKVLEIYNKNADIRRKLNANAVINDYTLDTYMHLSARNGMIEFLKLLLYENKGDPNRLNRRKQTVLHKVCEGHVDSVQYECMQLLLQWHDPVSSSNQLVKTHIGGGRNGSANITTTTTGVNGMINNSSKTLNNEHVNNNNNNKANANNNHLRNNNYVNSEINVNAKDEADNTPLHYAAMNNLATCVQSLVAHGAYLFVENAEHSTPCDLAEKNGNKDIALYLESKMIFSKDDNDKENAEEDQEIAIVEEKQNYGLRIQDLQEEKDKLLVETADMLRCNIFTAEILLKKHAWSKHHLLNAWIEDPMKCCEKCGISTDGINVNEKATDTNSINQNKVNFSIDGSNTNINNNSAHTNGNISKMDSTNSLNSRYKLKSLELDSGQVIARKLSGRYIVKKKESSNSLATTNKSIGTLNDSEHSKGNESVNNNINGSEGVANDEQFNENMCAICCAAQFDETKKDEFFQILCGHKFCKPCWEMYLTLKIEEGSVNDIVCPQVDCFTIIPHQIVESLVSKEAAQKYLHFDIKAFVESNPSIKWCPYPGCGMAVKNPKLDDSSLILSENDQVNREYSRSVDCGNGHYFCWDCLQEGHEPASCKNWSDWFQKILEIKPEELCNTSEDEETSANYLWLVTHSKRCPNTNCNAPIQKNEGCNHVKCYRCKHDFCWICLESWKKHSSATGGYFQCNRYEASNKMLQKEKATIAEAEELHLKAVELNKFVHYYTRFKNHEHSYKIEEPLLAMAKQKFEVLTAQQNASQQQTIILAPAGSKTAVNETNEQTNEPVPNQQQTSPSTSTSTLPGKSTPGRKAPTHGGGGGSKMPNESSTRTKNHHQTNAAFVKRLSHSLEKGVSKLFNSQDWTPLHSSGDTGDQETERIVIQPVYTASNDTVAMVEVADHNNAPAVAAVAAVEPSVSSPDGVDLQTTDSLSIQTSADSHIFIEEAIRELLKARRILRCSYVYGYYLDTFGHKKFIFEFVQTEFEECTENLSQIIARPHLKTPRHKIIRLTNLLKRKRIEFIDTITRGLNSFNDTPPTLKKYSRQRWKYLLKDNIQNDDEFKNTIALSLKELNPKNPWIIDKKGRHTNLLALLDDWPELEQDLESILVPSKEKNGLCARWECGNVRAVNTLSGSLCNYCSIKCMRVDHNNYMETKKAVMNGSLTAFESSDDSQRNRSNASDSPQSSDHFKLNAKLNGQMAKRPHKMKPAPSSKHAAAKSAVAEFDDLDNLDDDSVDFVDSDLIKAIELSKFQEIIDSNKKQDTTVNYKTFEKDLQKAIEMSLNEKLTDETSSKTTSSKATTSKQHQYPDDCQTFASEFKSKLNPETPAKDDDNTNTNKNNSNKLINRDYLTLVPYEPFYVISTEKDVGTIIKNMKNVMFDESSVENKVSKVCNFGLKEKV